MTTFPVSGRTHDRRFVTKEFEASLYLPYESSTLVRHYFGLAKKEGVSPHLGIRDEPQPKRVRELQSRRNLASARRSAIDDILSWACSVGFLDNLGLGFDYGLTKQG